MKQIAFLLAAGLLLAACQSPSGNTVAADNSACGTTAAARARDAGYNGYNPVIQQAIYDQAYTDCTTSKSQLLLIANPARR